MTLYKCASDLLGQLLYLLETISEENYVQPVPVLSNNSIGQHVRHIIDMYQCLLNGRDIGIIDYDERKREKELETSLIESRNRIKLMSSYLFCEQKDLKLKVSYTHENDNFITLNTNYDRELAYNIEHTIHHMALIKVGVVAISDIFLPASFGVASSTLKFKMQCAQ